MNFLKYYKLVRYKFIIVNKVAKLPGAIIGDNVIV